MSSRSQQRGGGAGGRRDTGGRRSGAVAVIGIGCRFPGAPGPEAFWELLVQGRDAVTEVPKSRFDVDAIFSPRPATPGRLTSRFGGFVDEVDCFDPAFFGLSPREATRMDPQQRILLEVAWEAAENAGLVEDALRGSSTGVFVGCIGHDYSHMQLSKCPRETIDLYTGIGGAHGVVAGRLSYALDLRGPSVTVDTACSSSLTAVHLACQSLRLGESTLAFAGGVNLVVLPEPSLVFERAGMLAPDGRCKFGDARADGFVRSDGVGVVILKPLSAALADGDFVHAVILGTGSTNDGQSSGLLATPGRGGQEAALRAAYRDAGVSPAEVQYVEAHGTGTIAGDPVELEALAAVLAQQRDADAPCLVGSVKTNIGHAEGAAGVAGLVKTILALRHGRIPASLHYETPNPNIAWDALPLVIPRAAMEWPGGGRRRVAGVSSFGISGTNVHVVLQDAPPPAAASPRPGPPAVEVGSRRPRLLPISAATRPALDALAGAYQARLASDAVDPELLCYGASRHRTHLRHRLAVTGRDAAELHDALAAHRERAAGAGAAPMGDERAARLAFVFPGQGSQWVGMGRQLVESEPAFREAIERCEEAMRPHVPWSLVREVTADPSVSRLDEIDVVQPTLFGIQVALAALWQSWGITPDAVIGHSLGEVAAAHVAGALTLGDAARVICRRSRLVQRISGRGGMVVTELSLAEARREIAGYEGSLSVAVSNSRTSTVISGETDALHALIRTLEARQVFCKLVNVSYAAHSPQIDELAEELRSALEGICPERPRVPLYSTVLGAHDPSLALDAAYWVRNLREPVLFASALDGLLASGHDLFLELSPHPLLLSAIQQELLAAGRRGFTVGSLRKDEDELAALTASLGTLYTLGRDPDWRALCPGDRAGRRLDLPSYPWQRARFWRDDAAVDLTDGDHPLLGRHLAVATQDGMHVWEGEIGTSALPYLVDHRVQGHVVFPAAGYVEAALAAAGRVFGAGPHEVEALHFENALLLDDGPVAVQAVVSGDGADAATFQYLSAPAGRDGTAARVWRRHAVGTLRRGAPDPAPECDGDPHTLLGASAEPIAATDHYRAMRDHGLEYGPAFRGIHAAWRRGDEVVARVEEPDEIRSDARRYCVHPALLDSCLQVLGALGRRDDGAPVVGTYVPVSLASIRVESRPDGELWARGVAAAAARPAELLGDIAVTDSAGRPVLQVRGLAARSLEPEHPAAAAGIDDWLYELRWEELAAGASPDEGRASDRPGVWLLLADRHGVADALRDALEASGRACVLAYRRAGGRRLAARAYETDPEDPGAVAALLAEVRAEGRDVAGVLHLWGLDAPDVAGTGPPPDAALDAEATSVCVGLTHAVRAFANAPSPPRLWLVTRDVHAVSADDRATALAQSAVWGLGRAIPHEHPELRCTLVDLGSGDATETRQLLRLLVGDVEEPQLAIRGTSTYVARLARAAGGETASAGGGRRRLARPGEPFCLETSKAGVLDSLRFCGAARPAPPPGHVEIRVHAAGVNFQDAMLALGVLPPEVGADGRLHFGWDCAGTVSAVGEGVESPRVGDPVVGIARRCFARYVVTPAPLVVRKPENLSFDEAATIPVVCMTAYHGLCRIARLQRGERVLVHAAAGGVGLAALQVARHVGAEVFATAGSDEKRAYLRSLGIRHVMDSRSLAFGREVMDATGGEGVDVVLNSLAGEFIPRSMEVLRPHGRFVEIGKMDILRNSKIGLRLFMNNVSFYALDYSRIILTEPERFNPILQEVVDLFARGAFTPIRHEVFDPSDVVTAFRRIATARQIGKAVVAFDGREVPVEPMGGERAPVAADGTYVITGGLRGLGLALAEWMAERGAGRIVLLGRGAPSPDAEQAIGRMRRVGAEVLAVQGDVADAARTAEVLREVRATGSPIRGVVHAAVVLADATLQLLDRERFERVMRPKVAGAWNLHRLTCEDDLDFFVLFSSAASVLGAPGQGNYSAANAFLDALAHHRRRRGLPCTCVNWGPWSRIGVAARTGVDERLAARGLGHIAPEQGLAALDALLRRDMAQATVVPWDLRLWRVFHPAAANSPTFAALMSEVGSPAARGARDPDGDPAVLRALPHEERAARIECYLARQVARILGFQGAGALDGSASLNRLGIDSLMATELRNVVAADLQVTVPVLQLLKGTTLAQLARYAAERIEADQTSPAALLERLDALSDHEVEALLASRLAAAPAPDGELPAAVRV